MQTQKSETRSFITYKKQELFDQLLTSIENPPGEKPFLWIVDGISRGEDAEIFSITEPLKKDVKFRVICPSACRAWALKNWDKVIAEAQGILLQWAKENGDTEFLESVETWKRHARERKRQGVS